MYYQLIGLLALLLQTSFSMGSKHAWVSLFWTGLTLLYVYLYGSQMYDKGYDKASEY